MLSHIKIAAILLTFIRSTGLRGNCTYADADDWRSKRRRNASLFFYTGQCEYRKCFRCILGGMPIAAYFTSPQYVGAD
ncbi:hypothetical protein CS542_09465 [Pedobacter sp. IW39]|nr:hypothetical protein CS542_09465 [Pedobacter sp. IW39]